MVHSCCGSFRHYSAPLENLWNCWEKPTKSCGLEHQNLRCYSLSFGQISNVAGWWSGSWLVDSKFQQNEFGGMGGTIFTWDNSINGSFGKIGGNPPYLFIANAMISWVSLLKKNLSNQPIDFSDTFLFLLVTSCYIPNLTIKSQDLGQLPPLWPHQIACQAWRILSQRDTAHWVSQLIGSGWWQVMGDLNIFQTPWLLGAIFHHFFR